MKNMLFLGIIMYLLFSNVYASGFLSLAPDLPSLILLIFLFVEIPLLLIILWLWYCIYRFLLKVEKPFKKALFVTLWFLIFELLGITIYILTY